MYHFYFHPDLAHLPENEHPLLAWNAHEWVQRPKSWIWWVMASILVVALTGGLVYFAQYSTAILVGTLATYYVLLEWRVTPGLHTHVLTKNGLWIEEEFTPYSKIEAFRVIYIPGKVSILELQLDKFNFQEIELLDTDPFEVRNILLRFAREVKNDNHWHHHISHAFKL